MKGMGTMNVLHPTVINISRDIFMIVNTKYVTLVRSVLITGSKMIEYELCA